MLLTDIFATGTSTFAILVISLTLIIALYIIRFRRNLGTFKKSYDEILLDEYGYVERLVDTSKKSSKAEMDFETPPLESRVDRRTVKSSDMLKIEFEKIRDIQKNDNHERMLTLIDDCLYSLNMKENGLQRCQKQGRILEEKYALMESTVRVLTGMKNTDNLGSKTINKFVIKSVIGAIILLAAFYILVFTDLSEGLKNSTIALITTVAGFLLGKFT